VAVGPIARRTAMRGISGYRHTSLEQLAGIGLILRGDALGNRLQALEARGRLKERALLAAMQRDSALGTVGREIRPRHQHGRAVETAGGRHCLHHPRQSRTGHIQGGAWTLRGARAILPPGPGKVIAAGVHVAALLIFTVVAFHRFWLALLYICVG
jgi:hypothetical protein